MDSFADLFKNITETGMIQCNICSIKVSNSIMVQHTVNHYNHVGFSVDICLFCNDSLSIYGVEPVLEHMMLNHNMNANCPLCRKKFSSLDDLYYHLEENLNIVYHCGNPDCLVMTNDRILFVKHLRDLKHSKKFNFKEAVYLCQYQVKDDLKSISHLLNLFGINENVELKIMIPRFDEIYDDRNVKEICKLSWSKKDMDKFPFISEEMKIKLRKLNKFPMSIMMIQTIMKYSCESCQYVSFESLDDVQKHIFQSHIGMHEEIIPRLIDAYKTIFQTRDLTNISDLKKSGKKYEKLNKKSENTNKILLEISLNNSPIEIIKSSYQIAKRKSDSVPDIPCKKRKGSVSNDVKEFPVDFPCKPCPKFIKMGNSKNKIISLALERSELRANKKVYRYDYSERILRKLMAVYDPPITEDLLTKVKPIGTFPMSFSVVDHKKRYHCETCHYISGFSHADLKRHIFLRHCKISWKYRKLMLTVSRIDKKSMQLLSDKELIEKINRQISRGLLKTVAPLTDSEDEFQVEITKRPKVPLKEKNGIDNGGEFLNKVINEQRKRSLAENEMEVTNQCSMVEEANKTRKPKRKSYLNENEIDSVGEPVDRVSIFGTKPWKNKKPEIDYVANSPDAITSTKPPKKKKDEADDFKKSVDSVVIFDLKSKANVKKSDTGETKEFIDKATTSCVKPKKKTKMNEVVDKKEPTNGIVIADFKPKKKTKKSDIGDGKESAYSTPNSGVKSRKKTEVVDINDLVDNIGISDLTPKNKMKRSDIGYAKESIDNLTTSGVKSKKKPKKNDIVDIHESADITYYKPMPNKKKNNTGDTSEYIDKAVTSKAKPKKIEFVDINESIDSIVNSYLKPRKNMKSGVNDDKEYIDSARISDIKPKKKTIKKEFIEPMDSIVISDLKPKKKRMKNEALDVNRSIEMSLSDLNYEKSEVDDLIQSREKIPASKRKSLSNTAQESANKIPSVKLKKPVHKRKDLTTDEVSDNVPFFEIHIVKKSEIDSVEESVDKIPIFKIKRLKKKNQSDDADKAIDKIPDNKLAVLENNEFDSAHYSIDITPISQIKSSKKKKSIVANVDESLEVHFKDNKDNCIAQTTNKTCVTKQKNISKKYAVSPEAEFIDCIPKSKNITLLTESPIGSSELNKTSDESKYFFPFSERVLQKYIDVSSPPIEENLIAKMKILNNCPTMTVTVNNKNRHICETCNYVSDISNVDIKRHIFRRHCHISNSNREIILKVSRMNINKQLCPDSELINEINNEISLGKFKTVGLLTDSEDESDLSIPKSKRHTSFEKKDLKLVSKEKFSYNEEVLRFRCTNNKLGHRFDELKQKMDIFQNYGMEVYRRNDRLLYVCSHCNWYSKNCRTDIIKHAMNTYAGFSKENKSCKRMVLRSVAKIKTARKKSKL